MKKTIISILLITLNAFADGQTTKNLKKIPMGVIRSKIEHFVPFSTVREFEMCLANVKQDEPQVSCVSEILQDTELVARIKITCNLDGNKTVQTMTYSVSPPNDQVVTIEDESGKLVARITQHYVSPCK